MAGVCDVYTVGLSAAMARRSRGNVTTANNVGCPPETVHGMLKVNKSGILVCQKSATVSRVKMSRRGLCRYRGLTHTNTLVYLQSTRARHPSAIATFANAVSHRKANSSTVPHTTNERHVPVSNNPGGRNAEAGHRNQYIRISCSALSPKKRSLVHAWTAHPAGRQGVTFQRGTLSLTCYVMPC